MLGAAPALATDMVQNNASFETLALLAPQDEVSYVESRISPHALHWAKGFDFQQLCTASFDTESFSPGEVTLKILAHLDLT